MVHGIVITYIPQISLLVRAVKRIGIIAYRYSDLDGRLGQHVRILNIALRKIMDIETINSICLFIYGRMLRANIVCIIYIKICPSLPGFIMLLIWIINMERSRTVCPGTDQMGVYICTCTRFLISPCQSKLYSSFSCNAVRHLLIQDTVISICR